MANTTHQAHSLMRQINEDLGIRFTSSWTRTLTADSVGNPVLMLSADSTPATTEQVVCIRVKPIDLSPSTMVDGLGLSQRQYSPHVIQFVLEKSNGISGSPNVPYLTGANFLKLLGVLLAQGCRVEYFLNAYTNVPAAADIDTDTSGVPAESFDKLWFPRIGSN